MNDGIPVLMDIYCDGLSLPQGATQSISRYHVRFSNIDGCKDEWFEIGTDPILQTHNVVYADEKSVNKEEKISSVFLFQANKNIFKASKTGVLVDERLVFPRINIIVCDRNQERPFFCLKSAGSVMDCTSCLMPL